MRALPCVIRIRPADPVLPMQEVTCRRALRILPSKREVFDGSWTGRDIVVKVFSHWAKARLHYWRELHGLRRLAARNVRAPRLLLSGRTEDGRWAVVTERIQRGRTGYELWNEAKTVEEEFDILRSITTELGRQHAKGVVQTDMHLNNFMLVGDAVFALDVAQMRFRSVPLGRRGSTKYLAHLLCCLPSRESAWLDVLAGVYAAERHWRWSSQDSARLRRQIAGIRRRALGRRLRKCLRSSGANVRISTEGYRGVLDREFAEEGAAKAFLWSLNDRMQAGQILKNGRSCFVSRIVWDRQDVVVKRYNHKGLCHSLRHSLKGSRAQANWLNAHRLRWVRIPTPRPLAYIEEYKGALLWQSYFITEFVAGPQVREIFRDERASDAQKQRIHDRILQLLKVMAEHGISHGDMKHSNIVFDGSDIVLMDLDAMRIVGRTCWGQHRCRRDVSRYLRDLKGPKMGFVHCGTSAIESPPSEVSRKHDVQHD